MDLNKFLLEFQDHLAPKLDTYEQAIYLYVFRHSRLIGLDDVVIGFKSARSRMAMGIGEHGKPMSEGSAYKKLTSLQAKQALTVIRTEHSGTRLKLFLPDEIPGLLPLPETEGAIALDEMDFFEVPENRLRILEREGRRCFYTLVKLDEENFVAEHVVSRTSGNNGYRNIVAPTRDANNRKGSMGAEDFLRLLYREGKLSEAELEDRLLQLKRLKAGDLKP